MIDATTDRGSSEPLQLAEAILDQARFAPSDLSTVDSRLRLVRMVYEGPYSRIFRVDRPDLCLKLCLDGASGRPDVAFACEQFNILKKVSTAMQARSSQYRVCAPLTLVPESAAIVMEWATGKTFAATMKDRDRSPSEAAAVARSAGLWLRHYHEAAEPETLAPDTAELRAEIDVLRHKFEGRSGLHATTGAALVQALGALPRIAKIPLMKTWLHGDFQTANFILGANAAYGLDFSYPRRGFALWDVAQMVADIRRLCCMPKGVHRFPWRRTIVNAFTSAYLAGESTDQWGALAWFELLSLAQYFARYCEIETSQLRRMYFDKIHANHLRRALRRVRRFIDGQDCQGM